jgi:hypothetical protein
MTRRPLVSLACAVAFTGASVAVAEEAPASTKSPSVPPSEGVSNPILAAPTADPARPAGASLSTRKKALPAPDPSRPRVLSPTMSAQLSALAPKFDPAVAAAAGKSIEAGVDLREIDKPRNTILRLPDFEVNEEKIPSMRPSELITPPERLRLALKKYPGLHVGSLPFFSNNGVALMMQAEDERLERMKEMNDLLSLLPTSQQKQVKPMVDDAFLRKDLPR